MPDRKGFQPSWVSAPGDTIADILEEQKLSSTEFAYRMECTPEHAIELLQGRVTITIDIARRLEGLLGASEAFWMARESQYRSDMARLRREDRSAGRGEWLNELPIKDMTKFKWIEPLPSSVDAKEAACLRFFGVQDVRAWRQTYRRALEMAAFKSSPSFDPQPGAVAAWLRQGEIEAASIDCKPWNFQRFREALADIRSLTRKKDPGYFVPELQKRCADCGVAVVIVRAPSGCRASGATHFLSGNKALLLLSFRFLSDDHFWFTFFHEAGHLLLHGKKALFLEAENTLSTKEENEANEFAARILVSPEDYPELLRLRANGRDVIRFASRIGVSPGVVVGQLQYYGQIKRNQLNALKRRFAWDEG